MIPTQGVILNAQDMEIVPVIRSGIGQFDACNWSFIPNPNLFGALVYDAALSGTHITGSNVCLRNCSNIKAKRMLTSL